TSPGGAGGASQEDPDVIATTGSHAPTSSSATGSASSGTSSSSSAQASSSSASSSASGSGGAGGSAPMLAACDAGSQSQEPTVVRDECGVFVTGIGGSDSNKGTMKKPFKTLGAAIAAAANGTKRVFACAETFKESVGIPEGVAIYGALDCTSDWSWLK